MPRASKVARATASRLAKKIAPGFISYLDPTEVERPPSGDAWAHEIKWDGYRAQAHLTAGRATIYTRNGNDWTARFGPIAQAVERLPARTAILDGEAVALDRKGVADFHGLRRQLGQAHGRIVYKAFDLLWLNGEDLRPLPWSERKSRLQELIEKLPTAAASVVEYVEPLHQDGATVYASVCRLGLEGIVSKRMTRPIVPGVPMRGARRGAREARPLPLSASARTAGVASTVSTSRAARMATWSMPVRSRRVSAPATFASWRPGYGR